MEALLIGIAAAFNFLIIKWKIEKQRYSDALLDAIILATLSLIFSGTLGGMVIATIGSAVVSISLFFSPPKLLAISSSYISDFLEELKRRTARGPKK